MDEITTSSLEKNNTLTIDELIKILEQIIYAQDISSSLPSDSSSDSRILEIFEDLLSLRGFIVALSRGDLSCNLDVNGFMAGSLKNLQANLRHLSWQTKMIAGGDMSQRVEFLGEFSDAFNNMVKKLDDTMKSLRRKELELMELNQELVKEINRRKILEQSLKESEDKYKSLSQLDPLTGIYNRRQFFVLAGRELKKALRYKRELSVLMLDLDFFKRINDTYGHAIGDKVLQITAQTISRNLRAIDIFARYGGEEFIIMLPETSCSGAIQVAERIRANIEKKPLLIDGKIKINLTISIGLCSEKVGGFEDVSIEKLIDRADQALYEAKRTGRNRVCLYSCS